MKKSNEIILGTCVICHQTVTDQQLHTYCITPDQGFAHTACLTELHKKPKKPPKK